MAPLSASFDQLIQGFACYQNARQMLADMLAWISQRIKARQVWALLHEAPTGSFVCRLTHPPSLLDQPFRLSSGSRVAQYLTDPKTRWLAVDEVGTVDFPARPRMSTSELESLGPASLVLPLRSRGLLIGLIVVGRTRPAPELAAPLLEELAELSRFIGVFLDKLLRVEEAALTGQYCTAFAHDLPSLLIPVSTLLQFCKGGAQQWAKIEEILPAAIKGLDTAHACLRRASHPEAPSPIRPARTPLASLLDQALESLHERCADREIRLNQHCSTDIILLMDRLLALRLLGNLLANAVKAAPRGSCVDIFAQPVSAPAGEPDHVEISIRNQSESVTPEDLNRLLHAAVLPPAGNRGQDGRGIGLGICHWITTTNGGRISFHRGSQGEIELRLVLLTAR
jgi:hypothetical protein